MDNEVVATQTQGELSEVNTSARIVATDICDSRFAGEGLIIALDCVREDNGENVCIELDIGMDEVASKDGGTFIPALVTSDRLKGIGYAYGDDFSQTDTLIDKVVDIYGKKKFSTKTGKPFWTWSLSRGRKTTENKEQKLKDLMLKLRAERQKREAATRKAAPAAPAAFVASAAPAAPAAPRSNPFA